MLFERLPHDDAPWSRVTASSLRLPGWQSVVAYQSDGDACVDEAELPAYDHQLVTLVESGRGVMQHRSNGRWRTAPSYPGRIGMTAPGQPTCLRWHGDERPQTTHVYLAGHLLDRCAAELWGRDASGLGRPDALAVDDDTLACLVRALGLAARTGADGLWAESAATFLTVDLLARYTSRLPERTPCREPARIGRVVAFLNDNLHRPIQLAEMAEVAGLSRYHFLRLFRRATGKTPYRYLLDLRLDTAVRHLRRGGSTMTETAYLCGFSTPSHFAASFRARFGITPSQAAQLDRWDT